MFRNFLISAKHNLFFVSLNYQLLNTIVFHKFRVDFIQLAAEYKPVNLGQGFPDDKELIPDHVLKALKDVASDPSILHHQYARGFVSLYLFLEIVIWYLNC